MTETGTGAGPAQIGHRVLGIYLNDHLAGATAGAELAHRMARTHQAQGQVDQLKGLAVEVAQDRAALIGMMKTLGVPVRAYKVCAAWVGEKAGRVKFYGRLLARSPQRPRRAGTAPARRRRQGSRLAHPEGAGRHGQAAGPRAARRADLWGAAPGRPARTPGPGREPGHQLLTAGRPRAVRRSKAFLIRAGFKRIPARTLPGSVRSWHAPRRSRRWPDLHARHCQPCLF